MTGRRFLKFALFGIYVFAVAGYLPVFPAAIEERLEFFDGLVPGEDIRAEYGLVDFAGEKLLAVIITTSEQTLSLGFSGGRIFAWDVVGMQNFVFTGNFDSGGLAMDLLWLPKDSRRSGDETKHFNLVGLTNDGKKVKVVFEADLQKTFPGLRIVKTYFVPAKGLSLKVNIELFNSLVDEIPVEISYWSHNKIQAQKALLVGENGIIRQEADTNILIASGRLSVTEDYEAFNLKPDGIFKGAAFGEFFPEDASGLIFSMPENFMGIYREVSPCGNQYLSSWISEPVSLSAGTSASFEFKVEAFPDTSPESIKKIILGYEE